MEWLYHIGITLLDNEIVIGISPLDNWIHVTDVKVFFFLQNVWNKYVSLSHDNGPVKSIQNFKFCRFQNKLINVTLHYAAS